MKYHIIFYLALMLLVICIDAQRYNYANINGFLKELEEGISYRHKSQPMKIDYFKKKYGLITPPDPTKIIAMARYVVHEAGWTSVATISTAPPLKGFPFTNVASMSDGPVENSTGIPYFYLTPLDFTSKDLQNDNRCTITVTLESTEYCSQRGFEPDDPRCARVFLSGVMKAVDNTTTEHDFALNALFTRHPGMKNLPLDHHFYVAKLEISEIYMLDWFGGPKHIPVTEYLSFNPTAFKLEKPLPVEGDPIAFQV